MFGSSVSVNLSVPLQSRHYLKEEWCASLELCKRELVILLVVLAVVFVAALVPPRQARDP